MVITRNQLVEALVQTALGMKPEQAASMLESLCANDPGTGNLVGRMVLRADEPFGERVYDAIATRAMQGGAA